MKKIHSSYLKKAVDTDNLRKIIDSTVRKIRSTGTKFNAIAFRGMSGALVAPAVSIALNKGLIMVRKEDEDSHSSKTIEGMVNGGPYIIIDDFISGGDTVNTIRNRLDYFREQNRQRLSIHRKFKLAAIFLYNESQPWGRFNGTPVFQCGITPETK